MLNRPMSSMIHNQRPLTLRPDVTVAEACRQMYERRAGAVLVTDTDDRLLGIFTGRDAVRMMAQGRASSGTLDAAMTRSPHTVPPGRLTIDALRLMHDGGFRHVPVVEDDKVVGLVAWGEFRKSEHDRLDAEISHWERL